MRQIIIFIFYIICILNIYDINLSIIIFRKFIVKQYEVSLIFLMLHVTFYVNN